MMNTAFLLTGSNLGNREDQLEKARKLISGQCGIISRVSSLYETAPWGKTDQPAFLNQALLLQTEFDAPRLLRELLNVENSMGRIRHEKYGPRIIDIDILFFNDEIIKLPHLTVPHPEIQNRKFALVPMNEIAPGLVHPILNKTIKNLLSTSKDKLEVKLLSKS